MRPGAPVAAAALLVLAVGPTLPAGAAAQAPRAEGGLLAEAVERDGVARLEMAVDPETQVCEGTVRTGEGWRRGDGDGDAGPCTTGRAAIDLRVRNGRVEEVDVRPALPAPAGVRFLGEVAPAAAADLLLTLVREPGRASAEAAEAAVFAATLPRDVEVWPGLLDVARDRGVPGPVRKAAIFWVGQTAADRVATELAAVAISDDERDVREAAVFALSRRPTDEALPALMELARTAPDGDTRRSAVFWLTQHDDPRVVDFLRELLSGGA